MITRKQLLSREGLPVETEQNQTKSVKNKDKVIRGEY